VPLLKLLLKSEREPDVLVAHAAEQVAAIAVVMIQSNDSLNGRNS